MKHTPVEKTVKSNFKMNFKTQMLYLGPLAIAEIAFPFLIHDTGMAMFLLLLVLPLLFFFFFFLYDKKYGFSWPLPAIVGLIWLPNLAMLNESAAIYIFIFGVVSYIGQICGSLFEQGRLF